MTEVFCSQIKNNDNLCPARSIVAVIANLEKDPQYKTIKNGDMNYNTSEQKRRAEWLMTQVGLGHHKLPRSSRF